MPGRLPQHENLHSSRILIIMIVQLKELAILDEKSGIQVFSSKNKTRQTFKQKPVMATIDAGQQIVESYDYEISLSGIISKASKEQLSKLAESGERVTVSGYAVNGMVLEGHGKVKSENGSFVIESNGVGGYDKNGKLKSGVSFSDKLGSMFKNTVDAMPLYFPFDVEIFASVICAKTGSLDIKYLDKNKEVIENYVDFVSYIPKHLGWINKKISIKPVDGCAYISISSEDADIRNISITIQ